MHSPIHFHTAGVAPDEYGEIDWGDEIVMLDTILTLVQEDDNNNDSTTTTGCHHPSKTPATMTTSSTTTASHSHSYDGVPVVQHHHQETTTTTTLRLHSQQQPAQKSVSPSTIMLSTTNTTGSIFMGHHHHHHGSNQQKPRRPMSAFEVYVQYEKANMLQQDDDDNNNNDSNRCNGIDDPVVLEDLKEQWKGMPVWQKSVYRQLAQGDRKRYHEELKQWNACHFRHGRVGEYLRSVLLHNNNQTTTAVMNLPPHDDFGISHSLSLPEMSHHPGSNFVNSMGMVRKRTRSCDDDVATTTTTTTPSAKVLRFALDPIPNKQKNKSEDDNASESSDWDDMVNSQTSLIDDSDWTYTYIHSFYGRDEIQLNRKPSYSFVFSISGHLNAPTVYITSFKVILVLSCKPKGNVFLSLFLFYSLLKST